MAKRILVAYGSKAGSTREVAEFIGKALKEMGASVDVRNVQEVNDLSGYDGLILGSATRIGKLLTPVLRFAQRFQRDIQRMATAYFVVGLQMQEDTPENRAIVTKTAEPLTRVKAPLSLGMFGGKVDHARLGWFMRTIASRDKSGKLAEGDWRDWDAIRAWVTELAPSLLRA